MKIKCPGCASLLQIPDSAAGKVVKCKCGKQLRAPAAPGASAPAATPQAGGAAPAGSPRPTPARPTPARPTPSRPLAAAPPASGIFDELTESDLGGVKAVHVPGKKQGVKAPGASAAALLDEAISGSDRRPEGLLAGSLPPRPGFLIFVGIANLFWAGICILGSLILFGIGAFIPAMEEGVPEVEGTLLYLLAAGLGMMALMSFATCVACFVRSKVSWYVILFSYGWGFADRVLEVVRQAVSEDEEIQIGKAVGGILIGAGVWAYMHGGDVRAYYQTEGEPIWKIIAVNIGGFVVGAALGAAIVFMV